jgi:hypothetical protein
MSSALYIRGSEYNNKRGALRAPRADKGQRDSQCRNHQATKRGMAMSAIVTTQANPVLGCRSHSWYISGKVFLQS